MATIPKVPKGYRLPVSFRKWNSGEVVAIFPTIPADQYGHYCQSYLHIGQHGAASPVPVNTVPATASEYAELLRELYAIGYENLWPIKRVTRQMDSVRRRLACFGECESVNK